MKRGRRRPGERGILYASISTPSAHAIANGHAALVEQAFDQLDPQDRNVILLAKIAALPRGEVAEVLGKSDGAVRPL